MPLIRGQTLRIKSRIDRPAVDRDNDSVLDWRDNCPTVGHLAGNGGTTCRASTGACDVAETCTGTSTACPADVLATASTVCRPAAGACDVAERCTGSSGLCPGDRSAADGTACSDGNGCTQTDTCQVGVCTGSNPVTCTASDACHVAGTCNPVNGACSDPAAPVGTPCDDGTVCNGRETCNGSGTCASGTALSCGSSDPCWRSHGRNPPPQDLGENRASGASLRGRIHGVLRPCHGAGAAGAAMARLHGG